MLNKQQAGNSAINKLGFYALVAMYAVGGINHFVMPEVYKPLIPNDFPQKEFINIAAGVLELGLAIGLLIPRYRSLSAFGIVLLLVAFIPSHVFFIHEDSCISESLCVPNWIGWVRLVVIHPLLMWWAWSYRNYQTQNQVK